MSWVSNANIKNIMQSIRNKFTTSDLVVTNDDKSIGAEFNYGGQDGLLSVSPLGTGASTEAALHLCNGDDTKKTELTQGTLSYVQGSGDSETYNYLSLLGDGVATFGKNGGGNIQVGGVADPTSAQQVATKNYVDNKVIKKHFTCATTYSIESGSYSTPNPHEYGYTKDGFTLKEGEHFNIPYYRTIAGVKYRFVSFLNITGSTNVNYKYSYDVSIPLRCMYGDVTYTEPDEDGYVKLNMPVCVFNVYELFTGYGFSAVVSCLYEEV